MVVKDVSEATVLTDEDASVLEIVLGILLVNSFEISIYDRLQEIRSSTDSSIQGSPNVCKNKDREELCILLAASPRSKK